jgi:hypothetical protein
MTLKANELMDKMVSLCKRRGFIFPSSEIYGGINGFWDYGPLGVELLRNIKEEWWRTMTYREDIEGIDAAILMHPRVWEASGHVANFTDPMVDCRECRARFRADQLEDAPCGSPAYKGRKASRCQAEGKFIRQSGGKGQYGHVVLQVEPLAPGEKFQFVDAIKGTPARILDTRKTTPGWRRLEKYAVACGGGLNHRFGLFDQVLIKDNHLRSCAMPSRTPLRSPSARPA